MDIELIPGNYNKAKPNTNDSHIHFTDTTEALLLYTFSLSETYMLDAKYSDKDNPIVQIDLLNKILRDLSRSTEAIEDLKKKIEKNIKKNLDLEK